MSRRRESNISDSFSIAIKATNNSTLILENIARTIQQQHFNEIKEKNEKWKEEILSSSKETATLINNIIIAEEIFSELGKRNQSSRNNETKEVEKEDDDKTLKEVQLQIQNKVKEYDPETSENVKKIRQILTVSCH